MRDVSTGFAFRPRESPHPLLAPAKRASIIFNSVHLVGDSHTRDFHTLIARENVRRSLGTTDRFLGGVFTFLGARGPTLSPASLIRFSSFSTK